MIKIRIKIIKRIRKQQYSVIPVIILFIFLIVTIPVTNLIFPPINQRKDRFQEDSIPYLFYHRDTAVVPLLVDHSPITIDGNDDFYDQAVIEGWSGNGSANNPFIIDSYRIDNSDWDGLTRSCIEIKNTDLHFVISNCSISRARGYGILIITSRNGILTGNNVSNNGKNGIWLSDCRDTVIHSNIISSSGREGIRLLYCVNVNLSSNIVVSSGIEGISVSGSRFITVSGNNITNNALGISIDVADNNSIIGNMITQNTGGEGLFFLACGINIYASDNNTVSYNSVSGNDGYGIAIINSHNNTIYYNNFISNHDGDVQAFDSEYTPMSFRVCSSINNIQEENSNTQRFQQNSNFSHNYWNDWTSPDENNDGIVDIPYVIDGFYISSEDRYPLVNPVILTTESNQVHGISCCYHSIAREKEEKME
ncbi:MAG: right-handed parallel beta-helix repeat-containing protein [Candidatus Hodarchaeales archaeon]